MRIFSEIEVMELEYCDFLQKFYLPNDGGGLVGYKAKKKISMFFFEYGLDDEYDDEIMMCPLWL